MNKILYSLFIFGLILTAGCADRETAVEIGNREKILHLGNLSEPKDLDPHIITGISAYNIIAALLEGLVAESPNDPSLAPVPGVAGHWTVSEDQTTYTFHLRSEAKWSNGDPVTAEDFVFSYQRILSPALGSPYAYMLHCLKNAKAYNLAELTDFKQVGVKAVDLHTLELTLEAPSPHFLSLLNHWSWFPVHPPTILKHGKIDQIGTPWTRPENYVGNGPFTLKSWRQNQAIIVEKSPTYWDSKTVRLNEIRFYPIGDHKIEERSYLAGQLHITGTVPLDRIPYFQEKMPEQLHINPYLRSYYFLLNVNQKPLDDLRVRQALSLAIDRDLIATRVTRSGEEPAGSFTPPHIGNYIPPQQEMTNLEKARTLLAEAGYPDGKDFPKITLLFHTSNLHSRIAEVIQQMWKSNLGIQIELENVEWKIFQSRRKDHQFQIARAEWVADYTDPASFLEVWQSGSGNNYSGWSNPEFDRCIAAATQSNNQAERLNYFQQAESILLKEQPIIPLLFLPSKSLIQPSVKGWNPSILDHHPYKHVYLEAE